MFFFLTRIPSLKPFQQTKRITKGKCGNNKRVNEKDDRYWWSKRNAKCQTFFFTCPSDRVTLQKARYNRWLHYNLTQLPHWSWWEWILLYYQISVHFELWKQKWEWDIVMYKVKKRMSTMKIELGELIAQPIVINTNIYNQVAPH